MKRFVMCSAALAFLLAGCAPSSENLKPQMKLVPFGLGYIEYHIRLKPNNDGTIELPGNSRCKKGAGDRKGCVAFEPGKYGVINISVSNPNFDDKTCEQHAQWVITLVQIADSGDIDTGKSSDFGDPVSPGTQATLYPFEDATTGTIYQETYLTGRTSVRILNRNDNPEGTTEDFWYYVEATQCRDHSIVAKTDPRIENKGR